MRRPSKVAALALRRRRQRRAGEPGERRIIVHLGPHKTATTFIQRMAEHNLCALPNTCEVIARRQRALAVLRKLTHTLRSADEARARRAAITAAAAELERHTHHARVTLISHEDLLGPLPGRVGIRGLYPFAEITVPAMLEGFASGGAEVCFVLYRRAFPDWLKSLHHYRHRKAGGPSGAFAPRAFARQHAIPFGWQGFHKRLRGVLPAGCLHILSYEQERDSGLVGHGLWQMMGLDAAQISALERIPPQNVTRPASVVVQPQA